MINTTLAQFCMAFNQAFGGPFGNAILSSDNKTLHITVGGVTRQFDENLQLVIDAPMQKSAYGVTCGSPCRLIGIPSSEKPIDPFEGASRSVGYIPQEKHFYKYHT